MGRFDNRIFASFNTLFSRIINNTNATIVGPTTTLTGEFPQVVSFERLYEYYNGWPQIKRSMDMIHQKFMGSGIKITSNNEEFNDFIKRWWQITNANSKWSMFFLSAFITGNGLMERQFAPDVQGAGGMVLANIEQVPMQTIFNIYRDQFGNDLKMVQSIDGIFKEIDPQYYIRMTINNPDRQAFGKSEFYSVAAPRKITNVVDPMTQQPQNPDRVTQGILDAEAELVDAQVEIKKIVARPKIFGYFPGMPADQLQQMEKEMSDPNNKKYFWAMSKKGEIAEAQISDVGKFDKYQEDLNDLISLAGGFPEKIITNPGGFSYASSITPMDNIDEKMALMRIEGAELIMDGLLRPLAMSFGFDGFDTFDVQVLFMPSIRKLKFEEVLQIPDELVPILEKREFLKDLEIPLNDELFEKSKEEAMQLALAQQPVAEPTDDKKPEDSSAPKITTPPGGETPEKSPVQKDAPTPGMGSAEYLMRNPKMFETYIQGLVAQQMNQERLLSSPVAPSPEDSINNTTSDRDPNAKVPDEDKELSLKDKLPNSPQPPTDIVATAPSQDEPPKVTDPTVVDLLQTENPPSTQTPSNNEPVQQGTIDPEAIPAPNSTEEPKGPGDVGTFLPDETGYGDNPDLAEANPGQGTQNVNQGSVPQKGQGIGPIRPTIVTEPPEVTTEPEETLEPGQFFFTKGDKPNETPNDAHPNVMNEEPIVEEPPDKSQLVGDIPPAFTGGLPPVGLGDNPEESDSRGLTLPITPAESPSNIPDNPNQQDPKKNLKRQQNQKVTKKKQTKEKKIKRHGKERTKK